MTYHKSVLLREAIDALKIRDAWYLDATIGDGGHSIEIIKRGGKVVGLDVDPQALKRVQKRFQVQGIEENKFRLVIGNFREVKNLISEPASNAKRGEQTETKFAGVVFDLGVSSLQLEDPERGFSFVRSGPLDMRMDPKLGVRALDLINVLSRTEVYELFKNLGEEKYSKRLADTLVSAREVIQTTRDLAELVEREVGRKKGQIHPATRIFQALRIAVNDELSALKEGLEEVEPLVEKNGHIVIISFHSLEDRITKITFRKWQDMGLGEIVTKKPISPGFPEITENPRSRSAKMRVFKIT